jgi:hypothetical protein
LQSEISVLQFVIAVKRNFLRGRGKAWDLWKIRVLGPERGGKDKVSVNNFGFVL